MPVSIRQELWLSPQYMYYDSNLFSTCCPLCWSSLNYFIGQFGERNMQSTLDFYPRPAQKETNVPLNKSRKELILSWYVYIVVVPHQLIHHHQNRIAQQQPRDGLTILLNTAAYWSGIRCGSWDLYKKTSSAWSGIIVFKSSILMWLDIVAAALHCFSNLKVQS
jgi:hypothetical protein